MYEYMLYSMSIYAYMLYSMAMYEYMLYYMAMYEYMLYSMAIRGTHFEKKFSEFCSRPLNLFIYMLNGST